MGLTREEIKSIACQVLKVMESRKDTFHQAVQTKFEGPNSKVINVGGGTYYNVYGSSYISSQVVTTKDGQAYVKEVSWPDSLHLYTEIDLRTIISHFKDMLSQLQQTKDLLADDC